MIENLSGEKCLVQGLELKLKSCTIYCSVLVALDFRLRA